MEISFKWNCELYVPFWLFLVRRRLARWSRSTGLKQCVWDQFEEYIFFFFFLKQGFYFDTFAYAWSWLASPWDQSSVWPLSPASELSSAARLPVHRAPWLPAFSVAVSGTCRQESAAAGWPCCQGPSLVYTGAGDDHHVPLRLVGAILLWKIGQTEKKMVLLRESQQLICKSMDWFCERSLAFPYVGLTFLSLVGWGFGFLPLLSMLLSWRQCA